jgi:hypothetical protein
VGVGVGVGVFIIAVFHLWCNIHFTFGSTEGMIC